MSDSACALRPDGTLKDASKIKFFNDDNDNDPMASVSTAPASWPLTSSFSQGKRDAFVSRVAPATVIAGS
jgi:hypothetical protein